jgi:hypothetical protein
MALDPRLSKFYGENIGLHDELDDDNTENNNLNLKKVKKDKHR